MVIRNFLLASVFTLLSSYTALANNSNNLQNWQNRYLNKMSPDELQITANFLYISYAVALAELKVRQFSTPLSRLHQSIRIKTINHENCSDDLAMLKILLDRLSFVSGARTIYSAMLSTCNDYYNQYATEIMNAALENIQRDAQIQLRTWADNKNNQTNAQLKKCSETINTSISQFQESSNLHKTMSVGTLPIEISPEDEPNKSIYILDIVLKNNQLLLMSIDNVTNTINETTDSAEQIIAAGIEIYKGYYETIRNMITSPTSNKNYATTMFSMHDLLPEEYKTVLPDPDHIFEHMLQMTKLYTQAELSKPQ